MSLEDSTETTPLVVPRPHAAQHDVRQDGPSSSAQAYPLRTANHSFKFVAALYSFVVLGLFTSSTGVMLPHISHHYALNDLQVSTIFPVIPVGYVLAASSNASIHSRFGQRGVAFLAPILHVASAVCIAMHPPFPVLLAAFAVLAMGLAFLDGSWCAWVGAMENANALSGLLHGSFSIGAALGPMIAGWMMEDGQPWWTWYYVLAGASAFEFTMLMYAFRHENASKYLRTESHVDLGKPHDASLWDIFKHQATWISAAYFLTYVGIETAISGWIVSFMTRARNASPYVANLSSSGFWAGMTVGRLLLGYATDRIGVRSATTAYFLCAISLQLLFDFTRSPVVSIMIMSLMGFCMGPLFPSGVVVLTTLLPPNLHVKAVSFGASTGQVGGAALPFGIGAVIQALGIGVFRWVVLGFLGMAVGVWIALSRLRLKNDEDSSVEEQDRRGIEGEDME